MNQNQYNNSNQMVPALRNNDLPGYPGQQFPEYDEKEVNLREYWRIIVKWRWVILTFFITIVSTTIIGSLIMKPVYKSTITIQIDKENINLLPSKQVIQYDDYSDTFYKTQYEVLKSRVLVKKTVNQLKTSHTNIPIPSGMKKGELPKEKNSASLVPVTFEEKKAELTKKEEEENRFVNSILSDIRVEPVRNSRLVKVSYESTDPLFSAKVVNALGKSYIDMQFENRFRAAMQAKEYLTKQLEELKIRVEQSEEKLQKYANANEIIKIDENQNTITKKLDELNSELTKAQSERISKESLYKEIQNKNNSELPNSVSNSLLEKLRGEYASSETEYIQLSKVYKKDYPKMKIVIAKMQQVKERIEEEKSKVIRSVKTEYMTALTREKALKDAMQEQKKVAFKMNESAIQYNILKREADTNKELYNGVLQKLKETDVTGGFNAANISILEEGLVPSGPIRPNIPKNIVISVLLGLFIGVGMALFLEYLDNTVKTPEDVEQNIKLPVLGLIPSLSSFVEQRKRVNRKDKEETPVKDEMFEKIELITNEKIKSTISEAYRSIRTALQYSASEKPPKVILSTSATQSEGKTTSAANLAVTFTQIGNKVVIIDCDLRRPRLHNIFGLNNTSGTTSYLTGIKKLTDILQFTDIQNLDVICSGPMPPNPSELLSSEKMKELIRELSITYDTIIIDSPPVLGITDTTILCTICDGVMLIVKGAKTSRELVNKAKKQIMSVGGKILGVLINDIDLKKHDYSYYSNYYYYYSSDYIYSSKQELSQKS